MVQFGYIVLQSSYMQQFIWYVGNSNSFNIDTNVPIHKNPQGILTELNVGSQNPQPPHSLPEPPT